MYRVELYAQVRRSVFVEGLSEREAAKRFGLARGTVRKMLRYATPPGYRRNQRSEAGSHSPESSIRSFSDQDGPEEGNATPQRIFDRLRDEYDFTGGYTIVKDYVRSRSSNGQEMFVPLVHPPGRCPGRLWSLTAVVMGAFVKAFPAETTEAFCEGHNAAFRYFGGVPRSILYDNTTLAVRGFWATAGASGPGCSVNCSRTAPNPGNRKEYIRCNGPYTLGMTAGLSNKLPFGNYPRLLLAWVSTEAVRTQSRELVLGKSLAEFMRELGIHNSGGREGTKLRNQMRRLFGCTVSLIYKDENAERYVNSPVTVRGEFWWNERKPDQRSLWT